MLFRSQQESRDLSVRLKLNPVSSCLKNRKVVVIDDSLVRGTTSKKLIHMLRQAGASEIHLRISAPPTISSCVYGIDTPTRSELLASSLSVHEICQFVGADSLGYLSLKGLHKVVSGSAGSGLCDACFSGKYPVDPGPRRV